MGQVIYERLRNRFKRLKNRGIVFMPVIETSKTGHGYTHLIMTNLRTDVPPGSSIFGSPPPARFWCTPSHHWELLNPRSLKLYALPEAILPSRWKAHMTFMTR
jgi:hypothetical protein